MESACEAYRAAIESNPDEPALWHGYIESMIACGRHEQAVKLAQDALIYNDNDSGRPWLKLRQPVVRSSLIMLLPVGVTRKIRSVMQKLQTS